MSNSCELINFTDLSLEQKKMILSWRNDERVKWFMYTNNDISLQNHLSFIQTLKNDASKRYFLVKKEDEFIGVIDFTNITKESLSMGLYANPALKGVGKFLLENIISYSFDELKIKKIYAEVFSQNKKAYNIYLKYGFKRVGTKEINSKRVICMELKDETNK